LSATTKKDDCAQVYDDPPSVYSATNFGPYSDNMVVRRKSLAGGSSKNIDKPAAARQTVPPAVTASPSSSEKISCMVLSTADAWNSSWRVTGFLEG
jgi:hypothetical protein